LQSFPIEITIAEALSIGGKILGKRPDSTEGSREAEGGSWDGPVGLCRAQRTVAEILVSDEVWQKFGFFEDYSHILLMLVSELHRERSDGASAESFLDKCRTLHGKELGNFLRREVIANFKSCGYNEVVGTAMFFLSVYNRLRKEEDLNELGCVLMGYCDILDEKFGCLE